MKFQPNSFKSVQLTVSGQKIAFSYDTRGIIWNKINMQELWFLCMNALYECMKFQWKFSNGYQVKKGTRNSIANDQREITKKISKAELWFFVQNTSSECALQIYEVSLKYINGYQVIEWTQFCDGHMDRRADGRVQGEKQYVPWPFQGET